MEQTPGRRTESDQHDRSVSPIFAGCKRRHCCRNQQQQSNTALHHPLLGAWKGEIGPVGAYLSGVLHALWGATTAAPRRRAAQAAPQGCLAAEFSLEGHGGALDVSPILGPR